LHHEEDVVHLDLYTILYPILTHEARRHQTERGFGVRRGEPGVDFRNLRLETRLHILLGF